MHLTADQALNGPHNNVADTLPAGECDQVTMT
jgi:hypothetical protein